MPEEIKILIVEDELIIAEDVKLKLNELGYTTAGIASDIQEANELLSDTLPDIALVDIKLRNNDSGIELAKKIKANYNIPIVFVTSHSDKDTIEKSKQVEPEGYIVKPFEKEDLFTAIELAIFRHSKQNNIMDDASNGVAKNVVFKDSIFIKKNYMLIKIRFNDLEWIKSDGNYLELYCKEEKHVIRSSLKEFMQKLPSELFLQIHKSFCVNVNYINAVEYNNMRLGNQKLPIGRSYFDNIKKVLNIDI